MENEDYRNWAELPPELTSSILRRLSALDILLNAQKVCRSWRRVCKDPSMWRKIVIHYVGYRLPMSFNADIICRRAVDLSQGSLVEIDLLWFGTNDLLKYIADRSSNLKSLRLTSCVLITDQGFVNAVLKLPLLEDLEMSQCSLSSESLKVLGHSCPNLKTLKVNKRRRKEYNEDALAIAETMPGLHYLQLCHNGLSDIGLNAILENCPNLEHLDIRYCLNVKLVGDLQKRCSERVKVVIGPYDGSSDSDNDRHDEYDDFSDHSQSDHFDCYDDFLF